MRRFRVKTSRITEFEKPIKVDKGVNGGLKMYINGVGVNFVNLVENGDANRIFLIK